MCARVCAWARALSNALYMHMEARPESQMFPFIAHCFSILSLTELETVRLALELSGTLL